MSDVNDVGLADHSIVLVKCITCISFENSTFNMVKKLRKCNSKRNFVMEMPKKFHSFTAFPLYH